MGLGNIVRIEFSNMYKELGVLPSHTESRNMDLTAICNMNTVAADSISTILASNQI